jgi:hypothetical protein
MGTVSHTTPVTEHKSAHERDAEYHVLRAAGQIRQFAQDQTQREFCAHRFDCKFPFPVRTSVQKQRKKKFNKSVGVRELLL